ncbi:MAG: MarR family transcriptional regulator [Spirochaetia bacterium]|nr:MarR family transcriptional regulator [Spirochaetia bacterium]
MKKVKGKSELIREIGIESRKQSNATIMFHQAVADNVGLHITDHKCLDLIFSEGPLTAGELAHYTGLTTGAITSVIDRLEKKGLVLRKDDPDDRRKVKLHMAHNPKFQSKLEKQFEGIAAGVFKLLSSYNETELALILDYSQKATALLTQERIRLRESGPSAKPTKD